MAGEDEADDAIYWVASRKRYVGTASLGYGPDGKRVRKLVSGKAKQEVKDNSTNSTTTSRPVRPAAEASVGIFADLVGATDGDFLTRCRLASCGSSDAPRPIASLLEQLSEAVAGSESRGWPLFDYLDASTRPWAWQVTRDLPAGWLTCG